MGASNLRIMLGEVSPSDLAFREIYRFPNRIVARGGHECWDIEYILEEIIRGIRKAADSVTNPIKSIGVDSWGVDFVILDQEGNLISDPVSYRDKRTGGMEKKWTEKMSREETFRRTGINFYPFNTLLQLFSMTGGNAAGTSGMPGKSASRILFLPSYVQSVLCGKGINELTISSTSQMLGAETGTWDREILDRLGIPPGMLGEVCSPGTLLGKINHPELALPDTDAIAVCSHDTASAVVSVPMEEDSSVYISTGTWCIVGVESDRPVLTPEALEAGFTNERGYGGSYRFLKNLTGLWLVQGLMKSYGDRYEYDEVESLSFREESSGNILDPGDPLFYNPEDMKQAFDEFFRRTGQELPAGPGGYFRCAYDSVICSFRHHIERIEKMTGRQVETIHLIGGGCHSEYLTRMTADICRRRVVSGPAEAATIGNILVQAIALGVLPDLAAARRLVRRTMKVVEIDPSGAEESAGRDQATRRRESIEKAYRKYLKKAGVL